MIATTMPTEARDNFPSVVVETLKKRAAFICSNPKCKIMTIAPSVEDENKVQYIGIAAHITAAAKGGPRYDYLLSEKARMMITNAIFLCNNCASLIDKNNGKDYKKETLHKWKEDHEKWVMNSLNKSAIGQQQVNINSSSENQSGGITANVIKVSKLNLNSTDDKKKHDKRIFNESDKIFNEDNLIVIIQSLLGDESIWSTNQDRLELFKYFFEKASNEYLHIKVEKAKTDLKTSLNAVLDFLANEFDMYPTNQPMTNGYNICMRPKLNIDREGMDKPGEYEAHNELYIRLREVVNKLAKDYKTYRKTVKANIYI